MSEINATQLLAQMRAMQQSAAGQTQKPVEPVAGDFSQMLGKAVDDVNKLQMEAGAMAKSFELGDPNVGLPEVMIALQKSSLSFQAATQIRNKLLSAYQDIMSMPI